MVVGLLVVVRLEHVQLRLLLVVREVLLLARLVLPVLPVLSVLLAALQPVSGRRH